MKGLVLTYLITGLASVGALRYPLIGLSVYVGFAVLRPQAIFGWAGDLSGMSFILGVALLIGWALKGFGSWRFERGRPVVLGFLAFVAWFAVSAALARDTARSFESLVDLSKLVLPFLVGVTLLKGEERWRPLLWTIVLAQGYVGFEMNLNYLQRYNRAAEGFGGMDNNCFAVSLLSVIGPAITLTVASRTWYARCLAAAAGALILHTILLTYSRGGMIGLVAVIVVAFVMMPKRPRYLVAILVTALVAVRFTGPQLAARYATAFAASGERDGSAQSRLDLWKDCLKVIQAQPVFGIGPNNWRAYASTFGWAEGKSAHSVWMETAAEVGIPGVLALIFFFGSATVRLWPLARARLTATNRQEVALAAGVILSIVGFSVAGQFVSVPGLEVPYYVTMLGAAMLKGTTRKAAAGATAGAAGGESPSLYLPVPARFPHMPTARPVAAKR
jgi:putative inorganic carbon (HCO3(-)) transporter